MTGILRDSLIGFRHNRARAFLGQLAAVSGIDAQNGGFRAAFVIPVYLWMVTKAVRNTTVGLTVTRCPSFNFTTQPLLPEPSDRL